MEPQTGIQVSFDSAVFQDEAIVPRKRKAEAKLPAVLAKARRLENSSGWLSRHELFLKQAELLADYEDDYSYEGDPVRYYPTYQSLTDEELRGYFAFRSKVRKGVYEPASLTFIFLYIYELLNNAGVDSPENGYEKLLQIKHHYGAYENKINFFLEQWLHDYVIYYNLDRTLLDNEEQALYSGCVQVIENIASEADEKVIGAIRQIAPKWLGRSRFYAERYEDMNIVICNVLRKMAEHYAKKCTRSLTEQLFGMAYTRHYHIFSQAVFCNPLQRENYEYRVNGQEIYRCQNGIWRADCRIYTPYSARRLDKLLKTIDSIMRDECAYKHPVKSESGIKWITALIREETKALLAKKAANEKKKIHIDLKHLNKIRTDALVTQERLIVAEEAEETRLPDATAVVGHKPQSGAEPLELEDAELRLLRCLLYGGTLAWIMDEGRLVSVLVDSINEKLYDVFNDTVLEEGPELVEDYISGLKEMIPA